MSYRFESREEDFKTFNVLTLYSHIAPIRHEPKPRGHELHNLGRVRRHHNHAVFAPRVGMKNEDLIHLHQMGTMVAPYGQNRCPRGYEFHNFGRGRGYHNHDFRFKQTYCF